MSTSILVERFDRVKSGATLPSEMLTAKRWLVWREEANTAPSRKPRKVPFYTSGVRRNGTMDSPEDVSNFGTIEDAVTAIQSGIYNGLGFALGLDADTGLYWQGIDLDHLSKHPENEALREDLIGTTYCETSPNGDGIHAIGLGRRFDSMGSTSDGIEAYSAGRFFTVTGEELNIYDPADLHDFVEKVLRPRRISKPKTQSDATFDFARETVTTQQITELRSALLHLRADDRDLWVKIGHALKPLGDVGRGLFMEWGSTSEKFDAVDAARAWDSFNPTRTGYQAVFKIAQDKGWVNPASKAAQRDSSRPNDAGEAGLYDLDAFALNGQSGELEKQLLDDKFILGRIAILGQVTVIYAPPNTGKTLLVLALLREAIEGWGVTAEMVYFVNADDHFKGAVEKLKLAEKHGFKMLVPSHNGFKAEMMEAILRAQCLTDKARGMVLILDTMKKFTDLMSKSKGTDFMKAVREFVSHGGSVILLAHTNKHRNEEGGLIYAGTADVVDDCDAAYTLDEVTADIGSGVKTVKFTNFKARGDNAIEEVYQYDITEGLSYAAKLESVRLLGKEEKQSAIRRKEVDVLLARNADAIKVIKDLIRSGTTKKTEIIRAAMADGISKAKVIRALKDHEGGNLVDGQLWTVTIEEKNCHVYKLNLFA